MVLPPRCLQIPQRLKDELKFLFLAKHALGNGQPHHEDGTHATYHREMLDTLRGIGLTVIPAGSFDALYAPPSFDFLITLYNRAGFRGSEAFGPLLAEMHGLPYLGGSPMVRAISDDKHFMKRVARGLGVLTPDWQYFPIGCVGRSPPAFDWQALIVKPNASSASWGIEVVTRWDDAQRHVQFLHQQGHDVIVEAYIDGDDLAAPVVGSISPWYLPVIRYRGDDGPIRTYAQKRDLVPSQTEHEMLTDAALANQVQQASEVIVNELWPFDHGRLEFRCERGTGRLMFIEVNLNCNLWSRKTISSVARQIGVSHSELIETILCHSLQRQGFAALAAEMAA